MLTVSVDTATSGANTIVAADTNRRIHVLSYNLVSAGTVTVVWKSGSTALTGAMTLTVGVPNTVSGGEGTLTPVLRTAANEALVLTLGGNVQVSGHVTYDYVR